MKACLKKSIAVDSSRVSEIYRCPSGIKNNCVGFEFIVSAFLLQQFFSQDNESTIEILHNKDNSACTIHITLRYNTIREFISAVKHMSMHNMTADTFQDLAFHVTRNLATPIIS